MTVRLTEALVREAEREGIQPERIAESLTTALDAAVPAIVDRLLRDAPRMLRDRLRIKRQFERRLQGRWGAALDFYRVVLEVALEAGSDLNARHRESAAEEKDYLFEAVTRLHARACLTGFEIHGLLESGFVDAATTRWRTLHELSVVANVLAQKGQQGDLAERFLLHERVQHARDALSYQKHAPALGYEPFSEQEMDQHRRTREELVRRYGPGFDESNGWATDLWSPPKRFVRFSELEEVAGLDHMRPWYQLQSHTVHAGSKGTALNMKRRGPHRILLAGPSNAGLADPGHGSLLALTQVTTSLLVRTRTRSLATEPLRIVTAKALLQLTDKAGDAFLAAHRQLQRDEQEAWAGEGGNDDIVDAPKSRRR